MYENGCEFYDHFMYVCGERNVRYTMRIVVHTPSWHQDYLADTGNIATQLVRHLATENPTDEYFLIGSKPPSPKWNFPENVHYGFIKPFMGGFLGRYLWDHLQWKNTLHKLKPDQVLFLDSLGPIPRGCSSSLVLLRKTNFIKQARFSRYIRGIQQVFIWTAFQEEQLKQAFGGLSTTRLTPGAPSEFKPITGSLREEFKRQFASGCEYFLVISPMHPDSNIIPLLKAFSMFKKRLFTNMIVGKSTPEGADIENQIKTYKFREDVIWQTKLAETDLYHLVGSAYGLIHVHGSDPLPVPMYWAQAAKIPTIAIHAGGAPEANFAGSLRAIAGDITDLAEKMGALYKDEALRTRLINQIEPIPSLEEAARQIHEKWQTF
jgi:glycosyltransferase involved in cell wall biosynthesis